MPHPDRASKVLDFESRSSAGTAISSSTELESERLRYPVVWWDPATLRLDVDAHFGIRQEELLSKEAPAEAVEQDLDRYRAWKRSKDERVARAAEPSLTVQLATERAEGGSSTPEVDVIQLPIVNDRPSGVRFGSLVHAVLATVPLDGTVAPINLATLHGRMLGASETEVGAAATVVAAALAHPILKRADAAMRQGNCRREVPVAVNNEDGALTEGVVDLAFFERASDIDPGTWTVVDFKTDKELDVALDVYRRQVALYAEMVARATGQVAVPVLVRV